MGDLSLHTSAPTVHWEDNTSSIYVVEDTIFTTRSKRIDIPVYFLQEQFENGIYVPKYEESSVMPAYMCTKPCSCPTISQSTKLITGFRLYPTIDTEHYQLMKLHAFVKN